MNVKIILTLLFSLSSIFSFGQYSSFKLEKKKDKDKKEVKAPDAIQTKTKGCEKFEGLFNIYQDKKSGKSYLEIDTSHLDQEFIYFSYFENGVTDAWTVKGRYRGSKIIKRGKLFYQSNVINPSYLESNRISVFMFVCLFSNSSDMAEPIELKLS